MVVVLAGGCASSSGTGCTGMDEAEIGGLGGAGIGALLGQPIARNTARTLIGAGVGASLGYIIGNEMDKKEAQKRQVAVEHGTWPLANTAWQVLSDNPKPLEPIKSKMGRCNPDGTLTTVTTYWDGRTVRDGERYRIVGQTLIINQDSYVINAALRVDGDRLYMDTGKYNIVLERM